MAVQPKPIKKFTRASPCTKVDLWNCFHRAGGFTRRAVVEARGEIGINAIKYLRDKGYANDVYDGGVDYWELTGPGKDWLRRGLASHLKRYPEAVFDVEHPEATTNRRRRVIRPA